MKKLIAIYNALYLAFDPQYWWPVTPEGIEIPPEDDLPF